MSDGETELKKIAKNNLNAEILLKLQKKITLEATIVMASLAQH